MSQYIYKMTRLEEHKNLATNLLDKESTRLKKHKIQETSSQHQLFSYFANLKPIACTNLRIFSKRKGHKRLLLLISCTYNKLKDPKEKMMKFLFH